MCGSAAPCAKHSKPPRTDSQLAMDSPAIPPARDKLLFTPGPLTTSLTVKQAMLRDAGSWHYDFNALVTRVRERLVTLAGLSPEQGWECVLLLQHARIAHEVLRTPEDTPGDPAALDALLARDKAITHVAAVHCETTTGILNDIEAIGRVAKKHGRVYVVDAMSSFGALPIDFAASGIDYLISSANKCIEGVPGFSFVFCKRAALMACEGFARNLSMNLLDQFKGFEKNGQFRYTPPTHAILAFDQALRELDLEGGVAARGARYRRNHETLLAGMKRLGFRSYLPPTVQSPIITSFLYPPDPRFDFPEFYRRVADKGFILYPGKLSRAATFRIGNIGRLFESDMRCVVSAIGE